MSKKLSQAGRILSVAAFYEGQNASGTPDHYESLEEARRMIETKKARSINRGTAILIRGPRRHRNDKPESVKSGWKVIGQTSKRKPNGPGMPRYSSV